MLCRGIASAYRFDSSGRMTGAIFYDHLVRGNRIYTRLEDHEFSGSTYSITVKAFRSMTSTDLGIEVSLTDVPEWSAISPHTEFSGVDRPLWGYFRVSSGNSTDRHSPLGVSVYAAAVDTIHDTDEQYGRLLWEYDGGQLALDVDQTALRPDINGESVMPQREQRLYRNWLNGSSGANGRNLYEVFAPALRDESYRRGMDAMLKRWSSSAALLRHPVRPAERGQDRRGDQEQQAAQLHYRQGSAAGAGQCTDRSGILHQQAAGCPVEQRRSRFPAGRLQRDL